MGERFAEPVYNIEVHGEHVYQVGSIGLLVHNACPDELSSLIGSRAITPPNLPAGTYPALVIEGQVYAARFHNVAWELAGRARETFYGFAKIDAEQIVLELF